MKTEGGAQKRPRYFTRKLSVPRDFMDAMASLSSPPAFDEIVQRTEQYARREPVKAVTSAFGIGFLIHLLPVGGIIGMFASVAFSLLRPALLVLGVMKAWEMCASSSNRKLP